jgi:hypothetical protein
MLIPLCLWLTSVVKEQLLSIQTLEDAKSRDVLLEKAPWWDSVFADFSSLYRLETRTSRDNMSVKRRARAESKKFGQADLGSPIRCSGQPVMAVEVDIKGIYQKCYTLTIFFRTGTNSISIDHVIQCFNDEPSCTF